MREDTPLVLPAQRPAPPRSRSSERDDRVGASSGGKHQQGHKGQQQRAHPDSLLIVDHGIITRAQFAKAGTCAAVLTVEIDPAEAGFEPERLNRIDRHYQRYVDEGELAGFLALIARDGKLVHIAKGGYRDVEAQLPVELDTQFRIYSMTKPITSVAAMLLWKEGAFELKDPVERFIPAFKDARVWAGGSQNNPVTVPAREPVRIWHLLTHTAGLTYGFHYAEPLDGMYRDRGSSSARPRAWTSSRSPTPGPHSRCSSSPARSSTTPSPPTSSAG